MRVNHEELLIRNPGLGACVFWHLARTFSEYSAGTPPELPYFFLGAAMIFHRATVDKIHNMQFDSGLTKAIAEQPDIVAAIQPRLEENALPALKSLQMAVSANLLSRERGDGFPVFRALGTVLPSILRNGEANVPRLYGSAKRLGAWFGAEGTEAIQRHLRVEF
jgi:hypothetical protein